MELRPLRIEDEASLRKAVESFLEHDPDWTFAFDYDPSASFAAYVQRLGEISRGENLQPGRIPATYLVAVIGDQIVGRVSIRHQLNDALHFVGGHIGYGVVPPFRRRGLATEILKLSLPIAKSVGIEKALLTCDDSNVASYKVIENHGGELENIVEQAGILKRRYWIDLSRI